MNFDTVIMASVIDELAGCLLGARIDKVTQPEPSEIVLGFYKDGSRRNALVSTEPNSARIHLIRSRPKASPTTAPAFCMLLRKYLEGGYVEEISQPLGFAERVAGLRVYGADKTRSMLWIELMGQQSNVILTSDSGIILGSIKRVTAEMSRLREVRAGIPYTRPPRQLGYKREPMDSSSSIDLTTDVLASAMEAEKWLTATFRGVGGLLAREAVLRVSNRSLTQQNLWFGLNEILTVVRLKEFAPVVYRNARGEIIGAYPVPLKSLPASDQTSLPSISEALEAAYESRFEEDTFEKQRLSLLAALRKSLKAAERQILDVREGLVNSTRAENIKESGELLVANLGRASAGAKELVVDDYFAAEPGEKRTILLDPALTLHENAERYFRRYQKARDSKDILLSRQIQLEQSIIALEKAITSAESATEGAEITRIAGTVGGEILPTQSPSAGATPAKPGYDGHKIKAMKSPDGWEILVGENSTSNDFLTTKIASPSDIWLHARAVPSAHAVIRAQNRPASVSTAAIMLAAEQVARRSGAKHAGLVSVDYTLKKYVRKPRGSAPGMVTYTNEKTIDVVAKE